MKKRIILIVALAIVCVLALSIGVACKTEPPIVYTVTFDPQNGEKTTVINFDSSFSLPEDPTLEWYKFQGWYTDAQGTTEWTVPKKLTENITVYAKWEEVHDFGDEYLLWDTKCLRDGCTVTGRNASTDSAKADFVYDFDSEQRQAIDTIYENLLLNLASGTDYDTFENLFEEYDAKLTYVVEQYQIAYVFYCTYKDETHETNYNFVSECYNENVSRYYGLFGDVYNSNYKDSFFEDWPEGDVDWVLAQADYYGNSQYTDIKNQISALLLEYNNLIDSGATTAKLENKYGELVELNNSLAELAGYDNYMEYAYKNVYSREYTPSDVDTMRNYVKQYIAPKLDELAEFFNTFKGFSSMPNQNYYFHLTGQSVFNPDAAAKSNVNRMGKYFAEMTQSATDTSEEINFYKVANELMKNGNYYTGKDSGAFTYWIGARQSSILYFSDNVDDYGDYTYQNAFTFVHEFGHYFNFYYNHALDLSMDHNETQSQGDEMMFLAWLGKTVPKNCTQGYNVLKKDQLANILSTICIATAVDEFEQAAYTGTYNGQTVDSSNYDYIFAQILGEYGTSLQTDNARSYWKYVVFDNAAYYISYAMSALPSVELFTIAANDFEAGKAAYFKLFTFSGVEGFVSEDGEVLKTYAEILAYAGINNPFEEDLYKAIANNL